MSVESIRYLQLGRADLARLRCALAGRFTLGRLTAAAEALAARRTAVVAEDVADELVEFEPYKPWTAPPIAAPLQTCTTCPNAMPDRVDVLGRCSECTDGTQMLNALAAPEWRPAPAVGPRHRKPGTAFYAELIREGVGGRTLWTYEEEHPDA